MDNSFADKVNADSTDKTMSGEWQVVYLMDYGYISEVNIEFIDHKITVKELNLKNNKKHHQKYWCFVFSNIQDIIYFLCAANSLYLS